MKDLVAGSGIGFEDRGEHALKGVPGTWADLPGRGGLAGLRLEHLLAHRPDGPALPG